MSDPLVLQSLALVDESQVNINLIEDLLQVLAAAHHCQLVCHDAAGYMRSASFRAHARAPQPGPRWAHR